MEGTLAHITAPQLPLKMPFDPVAELSRLSFRKAIALKDMADANAARPPNHAVIFAAEAVLRAIHIESQRLAEWPNFLVKRDAEALQ